MKNYIPKSEDAKSRSFDDFFIILPDLETIVASGSPAK